MLLKKIRRLKYWYKNINTIKNQNKGNRIYINGPTSFNSNMIIGDNCHFNGLFVNGKGKIIIGDNFHSGKECLLITDTHNYKGEKLPYDNTYIIKTIEIGTNVWIGDRVIILGGVTIGEGSIIQAGSVVTSDIPKYSIAGGHPAVVFSYRDIEHYKKLKKKKAFF